ncbi:MAG: hypothetical protein M3P98_02315 [bacterium]|nr:hypothetical protein [bacterium]
MDILHEKEPREFNFEEFATHIPRDLAHELDEHLTINPEEIGNVAAARLITLENTVDFGDEIEEYLDQHPSTQMLYDQAEKIIKDRTPGGVSTELSHQIKMRRAVAVAAMLYDLRDLLDFPELPAKDTLAKMHKLNPRQDHHAA